MGARGVAFLRSAIGGLFLLAAAQLAPAQAQSPELDELYRHGVQLQAQSPELDDLYRRGFELYQARKYAEAIPIAEQYLKVAAATFGEDNPVYANGLVYLAVLNQALNRTAEAEPLFKRALAIKAKALGPDHQDVAEVLFKLAELEGRANTSRAM